MKLTKTKSIAWIIIALVISSAGALWLSSSKNKSGAAKISAAKPALTITTARPSRTPLPITLAANGNIVAWQEAIIGSEANGLRLTEVRVNVGDRVRAGQVLAVFDAQSIQTDAAQARAALHEALANAAEASANAARARKVEASGFWSKQQIAQYYTAEKTAQSKVAASRAALAAQNLRLKQTRVVAPDSGIISARTATVGAVVSGGSELFRMIRQGRLEWRAEVTASELGRLRPGTLARVSVANGTQLEGRVRMIAPTVDPQTRAALVYVDLPRADGLNAPAKAGMFAKGEFEMGTSTALTVPQQAVVLRDGFSYVFQLNADNRVSQVKIRTGRRLADQVEVLDGISPDALLVVKGAGFLNDGDVVKIVNANADRAASGANVHLGSEQHA